MLHAEILERLSRLPSGGIISDQSRFDQGYLSSMLDTFRAKLLNTLYNGDKYTARNKRINPQCYQKYYPEFEKDLQESRCLVVFRCPEVISFDEQSDGFRYIGTIEGSCNFQRVRSRAQLSTYNQHRVMNVNTERAISVLYDGATQLLEFYGNGMLKQCLVEGIFAQPLLIPTYNMEFDQYPLADNDIPQLEKLILMEQTRLESLTPIPAEYKEKV